MRVLVRGVGVRGVGGTYRGACRIEDEAIWRMGKAMNGNGEEGPRMRSAGVGRGRARDEELRRVLRLWTISLLVGVLIALLLVWAGRRDEGIRGQEVVKCRMDEWGMLVCGDGG